MKTLRAIMIAILVNRPTYNPKHLPAQAAFQVRVTGVN